MSDKPRLIGEFLGKIIKNSETQPAAPREVVPAEPAKRKPPKKINKVQEKIVDAAVQIMEKPETPPQELAFLTRQLVLVTLPHSDPGDVPVWTRKNGNVFLSIQSSWDHEKGKPIGYPYGILPRLLMFWINTEVLRTQSRRLELGNSLAKFMLELRLDPGRGGKRSDAYRLRDQMNRLFSAKISFTEYIEAGGRSGKRWLNMDVAPKGELWWDHRNPEQGALWGSWIELGEDFYNAIIASPVPVDMRALRALSKSPMALDLYSWTTWRAFTVSKKGEAQFIPWSGLAQQLGADYNRLRNFRAKFKAALHKVMVVYPDLRVEEVGGGINILPTSAPAVQHRPKKPKALSPPSSPNPPTKVT